MFLYNNLNIDDLKKLYNIYLTLILVQLHKKKKREKGSKKAWYKPSLFN